MGAGRTVRVVVTGAVDDLERRLLATLGVTPAYARRLADRIAERGAAVCFTGSARVAGRVVREWSRRGLQVHVDDTRPGR